MKIAKDTTKKSNMRKIRVAIEIIIFTLILFIFLDPSGKASSIFGFIPKIQFLPALFATNIVVIIGLILITLIFGRIYCSVICPMGMLQDVISRIREFPLFRKKKSIQKSKMRFSSRKENKILRYGVLTGFIVSLFLGFNAFAVVIAPYSAFGRIANNILNPITTLCTNIPSTIEVFLANNSGNIEEAKATLTQGITIWNTPILIISIVSLLVIVVAAWWKGRIYCNTICPVGTILSFFSRFALFRPMIDFDKCKKCKLCELQCKSSCINIKEKSIDYSRCVSCLNCIDNCKFDALHYTFTYKNLLPNTNKVNSEESSKGHSEQSPIEHSEKEKSNIINSEKSNSLKNFNLSRRAFLTSTGIVATTLLIDSKAKRIRNLANKNKRLRRSKLFKNNKKQAPKRERPITPFGSINSENFYSKCTSCQLCVSQCPENILRPSTDLTRFMQPEMSYEKGYCKLDCTKCSDICPSGAILPITTKEKLKTKIGTAEVVGDRCVGCGVCSRVCPVGAIEMFTVPQSEEDKAKRKRAIRFPIVNTEKCIGCGACENNCPINPLSAIIVQGL